MDKLLRLCLTILGACVCVQSQEAMLQWKYGEIHGVSEIVTIGDDNFTIHKYLGIPFAQPPVGDLRFRKPQPIMDMDSPFYATNFSLQCVQFNSNVNVPQSEDCLYLNIYVPKIKADETTGHAVAIWIHGGGFISGSGSSYNGTFMSLYGNVIIVTINYRLGPYGFLSTEDDNAPGNYAFWDQHLAFEWVHDNIADFGGDNRRVTIFGVSAGAMSVSYQALIPANRGLFQRIIAQSGTAIKEGVFKANHNALEDAQRLAELIECDTTTTDVMMHCIRNISSDELKDAMMKNGISPMDFTYVVDDVLIKRDILTIPYIMSDYLLDEVEFYRSLDAINGFNSHEGVVIALNFLGIIPETGLMSPEQMKEALYPALGYFMRHPIEESVMEMVMGEYTYWTNPESYEHVRHQVVKLFGDLLYGAPAIESARMHITPSGFPQIAKNYVYYFAANPSFGPLTTPEWVPGANHGDELSFVKGIEALMPGRDPNTTWEIQLSRKMVTYWTNFMKSGDPNGDEVSPVWPEYDMGNQSYITLEEHTTEKSVGRFLYARENNFWFNVFPGIMEAIEDKSDGGEGCVSSARQITPSIVSILCLFVHFKFMS